MPGPAGQLAVGLGHVRGGRLVPARDQPDRRVVERVEHARGSSRPGRRTRCRRRGRSSWSTRICAAGARHRRDRLLEEDRRALELRLLLVGRVDVADRPLARPLARAGAGRGRTPVSSRRRTRSPARDRGPLSNHASPAPYVVRLAAGLDRQRAEEQVADARARVGVPVGDPPGGKSTRSQRISHSPALELDLRGEQRRRRRLVERAPRRARAVGSRRAVRRLVAADVVDDAVARRRLDAAGDGREREDQWKYCPPSMTIVWPGDEVGRRRAEEDDGADDVLGHLVALDRPRGDRHVAQLLDHLRVAP